MADKTLLFKTEMLIRKLLAQSAIISEVFGNPENDELGRQNLIKWTCNIQSDYFSIHSNEIFLKRKRENIRHYAD